MNSVSFPAFPTKEDPPRGGGIWPEYAATMLICFSGMEGGTPYGRLWSFCYREPVPFKGLDQLLLVMNELMDRAGYPEAWCELRRWGKIAGREKRGEGEREFAAPKEKRTPAYGPRDLRAVRGALLTIPIRVYSRQSASMQGVIRNGRESVHFRSALELLRLLWQALPERGGVPGQPLRGAVAHKTKPNI